MLFHSQGFILIFLPLVLAAYYATAQRPVLREWVLLVASLAFFSWWDLRFLPVLLGQATATWGAAALYRRTNGEVVQREPNMRVLMRGPP